MATVPGSPDPVTAIHPAFRPTQADFLQAAAIMHQQGKFQVAGDVVKFPTLADRYHTDPASLEDIRKSETQSTLMKALGSTAKVLPIKPEGN